MYIEKIIVAAFLVAMVHGRIPTLDEKVNLLAMCRGGVAEVSDISTFETLTVDVRGEDWGQNETTCTVMFTASDRLQKLIYEFGYYRWQPSDTTVKIETYPISYKQFFYSKYSLPGFENLNFMNRTMRVTVQRPSTARDFLHASFKVYTIGGLENSMSGCSSITHMGRQFPTSGVVAITAVSTALLAVIIVSIWCCVRRRGTRNQTRTVMSAQLTKEMETNAVGPVYAYTAPPEIYPQNPAKVPAAGY